MNKSFFSLHLINFLLFLEFILSQPNTITMQLTNLQNGLYAENIQVGSMSETFFFKLDLWTDVSWLMSSRCNSCLNLSKYNESLSTSFKETNQTLQVNYSDLVEVYGSLSTDLFSFSPLNKSNLSFLLVTDVTEYYEPFIGVLGFGIPKENNIYNSFIYQLKQKNLISNLILGISLKQGNEDSVLTIGGYDTGIVKNTSNINYCNALNNSQSNFSYWGCQISNIQLGSTGFNFSKPVVFDTGIDDIRIPLNDFLKIKNSIFKNKVNCQYGRDNYFHCFCDSIDKSSINNIEIKLDNNYTLNITPNDFAFIQTQSPDNINCVLFISVSYHTDIWVIGNNYLNNFYTIFNYENNSIGFYDIRKDIDEENSLMILFVTIIFVFSTCFFFIILLAIYKKCINRNNRNQQNAYQHI